MASQKRGGWDLDLALSGPEVHPMCCISTLNQASEEKWIQREMTRVGNSTSPNLRFPLFTQNPIKVPTLKINNVCYVNVIFVIKQGQ